MDRHAKVAAPVESPANGGGNLNLEDDGAQDTATQEGKPHDLLLLMSIKMMRMEMTKAITPMEMTSSC